MITECPICGGRIQATVRAWFDNTELDDNFRIYYVGDYTDRDPYGANVYCENDHTVHEMKAHVHAEQKCRDM